MYNICENLNIL